MDGFASLTTEFILSGESRFFAEFTLRPEHRFFAALRMTGSEGLRMTGSEGLRMTKSEGLRMTDEGIFSLYVKFHSWVYLIDRRLFKLDSLYGQSIRDLVKQVS